MSAYPQNSEKEEKTWVVMVSLTGTTRNHPSLNYQTRYYHETLKSEYNNLDLERV